MFKRALVYERSSPVLIPCTRFMNTVTRVPWMSLFEGARQVSNGDEGNESQHDGSSRKVAYREESSIFLNFILKSLFFRFVDAVYVPSRTGVKEIEILLVSVHLY